MQERNVCTGIAIITRMAIDALTRHINTFIFAKRYDDAEMLLRLYDPYVLHDIDTTMSWEKRNNFLLPLRKSTYIASDRRIHTKTA